MLQTNQYRKDKKIEVTNVLLYRHPNRDVYEIGLIDKDYKYYYHHLQLRTPTLTLVCYAKLNHVFSKYLITSETDIFYLEGITKKLPIFMYLNIMNQNVFANVRQTTQDKIAKRISTFHPTYLRKAASQVTKYSLEKLWKKILELDKCPWITNEVNLQLELMSDARKKIQKILMLGLYYQIIKKCFYQRNLKYEKRNKYNKYQTNNNNSTI